MQGTQAHGKQLTMWALVSGFGKLAHKVPQHASSMPPMEPALCGAMPDVMWYYLRGKMVLEYRRCGECTLIMNDYARNDKVQAK